MSKQSLNLISYPLNSGKHVKIICECDWMLQQKPIILSDLPHGVAEHHHYTSPRMLIKNQLGKLLDQIQQPILEFSPI